MNRYSLQYFFGLLLSCGCFLYPLKNAAQQTEVFNSRFEALKKITAPEEALPQLKNWLNTGRFSNEEKLKLQAELVRRYSEQKKWDTCLQYCQEQLALAHQEKNTLAEATFYKSLGTVYYFIPDYDKAETYWKKAIATAEAHHHDYVAEQSYHNLGAVYLERGIHLDLAEQYLKKSVELSHLTGTDTGSTGLHHYRLLATLYDVNKDNRKSDSLFQTIIVRSRELNDSARLAEALMFYARSLSSQQSFAKAVSVGEEALAISQKTKDPAHIVTAIALLAEINGKAGNFKEAYRYAMAAADQNRAAFNIDLNKKISEAEAVFKTKEAEHEKQMTILTAKKEKQLYLIGGIAILLITGISFYYYYQKRNTRQKLQLQQEKERLSRDLHDNLGSLMALLSNNVSGLETRLQKKENVQENLELVKQNSRQLLQTLRETIWILHKENVPAPDFFDKLVEYARRYLQPTHSLQLKVQESFPDPRILQSNEALQLFRICQEAINNASKYSGAAELLLKGETIGKQFIVTIADNGTGFDRTGISGEHYGLKNMEKRAAEIGASISIRSEAGTGTTISVRL